VITALLQGSTTVEATLRGKAREIDRGTRRLKKDKDKKKKSKSGGGGGGSNGGDCKDDGCKSETGVCTDAKPTLTYVNICDYTTVCPVNFPDCKLCGEGQTCKLISSGQGTYKACASRGLWVDYPSVCDPEIEVKTVDQNGNNGGIDVGTDSPTTPPVAAPVFPPTPVPQRMPTRAPVSQPTPAPQIPNNSDCVAGGRSPYANSMVHAGGGDPDECTTNKGGACPGCCKAYLWNVCDCSGQFNNARDVKLLCD